MWSPPAMKPIHTFRASHCSLCSRHAFSLVELLVVIAIIGVLAGIMIPILGRTREAARSADCGANLRGLGAGYLLYVQTNKGKAPYEAWTYPTWISELMPLIVGQQEYDAHVQGKQPFSALTCPTSDEPLLDYWYTHYAVNINLISYASSSVVNANLHPLVVANNPGRIILAMDFHSNQRVVRTTSMPSTEATLAKTFRHSGKANAVYLDGHVGALSSLPPFGTTTPWQDW